MKYIVYITINLINRKMYIGVHRTKDPDIFDGYIGCGVYVTRYSTYNNPNTAFQYAVKKYGPKNFKRYIIKVFNDEKEAYKLESILVDSNFINREDTYNMVVGGKYSLNKVPVYQFDTDGNLIKKWDCTSDAAREFNVSDNAINNSIKYKGSCCKYYWSNADTINPKEYTYYTGTKCYKYNSNGKYLESYESMKEAAVYNNVPIQSIQRAVKGGYKVEECYYKDVLDENIKVIKSVNLNKHYLYIYTLSGEFIKELHNKSEIKEFFNINNVNGILVALRTGRQYRNYQLSLEKVESLPEYKDKRNIKKAVAQYDLNGNYIKTFSSITQACKEFGTGVQKVLRNQADSCKNYVFKFI